jgi:hypothetical protein
LLDVALQERSRLFPEPSLPHPEANRAMAIIVTLIRIGTSRSSSH